MYLDEHRNELQDNVFNFMDLAKPEQINFLNFQDKLTHVKF